jgi:hypothetical protein
MQTTFLDADLDGEINSIDAALLQNIFFSYMRFASQPTLTQVSYFK